MIIQTDGYRIDNKGLLFEQRVEKKNSEKCYSKEIIIEKDFSKKIYSNQCRGKEFLDK